MARKTRAKHGTSRAKYGTSSERSVNMADTQAIIANAMGFNVYMAQALVASFFAAAQIWARCAERLQAVNAESVTDLSNVATAAVEEMQYATALPEFTEACQELMAGRFQKAAQDYGALLARLAGIEAGLLQQAQAAAVSHVDELVESMTSLNTRAA